LGRYEQNSRAKNTSDNTSDDQRWQKPARRRSERFAVCHGAGNRPWPNGRGVGGVGGDGCNAGEKQSREGYEATASCDRIDGSCNNRREKQENWMTEVHAKEYMEAGPKSPGW